MSEQHSTPKRREIRFSSSGDPELDAIRVIGEILTPLDRHGRERVLKWAEERYVHVQLPGLGHDSMDSVNKFMESLAVTASRHGMASPLDLLKAMANVANHLPSDGESIPGSALETVGEHAHQVSEDASR